MIKPFGALVQGDRFEMTISATGNVITVEVDEAPKPRTGNSLMLRGHDVATGKSLNAFGKAGAQDKRTLVH